MDLLKILGAGAVLVIALLMLQNALAPGQAAKVLPFIVKGNGA